MSEFQVHNEFFYVDDGHRVGLATIENDGLTFFLFERTQGWTPAMSNRLERIARDLQEENTEHVIDPVVGWRVQSDGRGAYVRAYHALLEWSGEYFVAKGYDMEQVRETFEDTTERIEKWGSDE